MTTTKFDSQFQWSRKFLTEMKRTIGEHLIGEAPAEEDMQRNTDLVVLRLDVIRVACRVRKHRYLADYGDQFTIRAGVISGRETELTKVVTGWGQYMLYGFADAKEESLASWILADLNVFRLAYQRSWARGTPLGVEQSNGDGSSFMVFHINDFPKDFIVARKQPDTDHP